ncbi:MAG TPA: hypothetical protein PK263_01110, partial [bacterium]|nr:hypothetical protein [bacterium]
GDGCYDNPGDFRQVGGPANFRYIKTQTFPDLAGNPVNDLKVYTFSASGTHTSALTQIDGTTTLQSWDSFTPSETDYDQGGGNAATKIEYEFRSGNGTDSWTDWSAKQEYSGTAIDLGATGLNITANSTHRYLQVRSTLTTTDGSFTPTLASYTVSYTRDSTCDTFDHIVLSPTSAEVAAGGTQTITATAVDSGGNTVEDVTFTYEISGGTIDESGLFTAPDTPGTYTITVTSSCGGSETSTITVPEPDPDPDPDPDTEPDPDPDPEPGACDGVTSIILSPATSTIYGHQGSIDFTVTDQDGNPLSSGVTVTYSATDGTIDENGLFTIRDVGTYTITVTTSCGSATAIVSVPSIFPPSHQCYIYDHIVVSPSTTITLNTGETTTVTGSAVDLSGTALSNISATYSADGGTIDSSGNYTAPSAAGTYTITITTDCGSTTVTVIVSNSSVTVPVIVPECSVSVRTLRSESITSTTATLVGKIVKICDSVMSERGFQYGISKTDKNYLSESGEFGVGEYSLSSEKFIPDTKYYFRAYAKSGNVFYYGGWLEFVTLSDDAGPSGFEEPVVPGLPSEPENPEEPVTIEDQPGGVYEPLIAQAKEIFGAIATVVTTEEAKTGVQLSLVVIIIGQLGVLASSVASNVLSVWSVGELLPQAWKQALFLLGFRPRRKNRDYGVITEANTGLILPFIPLELVLVVDGSERVVHRDMADQAGRFILVAEEGFYKIRVKKAGYSIARVEQEGRDMTQGFKVGKEGAIIKPVIILNQESGFSNQAGNRVRKINNFGQVLNIILWIPLIIGTLMALIRVISDFGVQNGLLFLVHILILVWILLGQRYGVSPWGLVKEVTSNKPIDLALIRAVINGKLVRTVASNEKGHYSMVVPKGTYSIAAVKPGFQMKEPAEVIAEKGLTVASKDLEMITLGA